MHDAAIGIGRGQCNESPSQLETCFYTPAMPSSLPMMTAPFSPIASVVEYVFWKWMRSVPVAAHAGAEDSLRRRWLGEWTNLQHGYGISGFS